jgi:hypothetical protein
MPNILVYTQTSFNINCGGILVQYEICRILDKLGFNVRMLAPENIENCVFNNWNNMINTLQNNYY